MFAFIIWELKQWLNVVWWSFCVKCWFGKQKTRNTCWNTYPRSLKDVSQFCTFLLCRWFLWPFFTEWQYNLHKSRAGVVDPSQVAPDALNISDAFYSPDSINASELRLLAYLTYMMFLLHCNFSKTNFLSLNYFQVKF